MNNEIKPEFKPWPKIPRGGNREAVTITEKMDGTNSCIIIDDGEIVGVQSRNRLIYVGKDTDNYGFAAWVYSNEEELLKLGDGYHYGEWVGEGINGNNHNLECKEFYLFNVVRWNTNNPNLPKCCKVVPLIYNGVLNADTISNVMLELKETSDDYKPEGIIVWYHNARRYEKVTFEFSKGKWGER